MKRPRSKPLGQAAIAKVTRSRSPPRAQAAGCHARNQTRTPRTRPAYAAGRLVAPKRAGKARLATQLPRRPHRRPTPPTLRQIVAARAARFSATRLTAAIRATAPRAARHFKLAKIRFGSGKLYARARLQRDFSDARQQVRLMKKARRRLAQSVRQIDAAADQKQRRQDADAREEHRQLRESAQEILRHQREGDRENQRQARAAATTRRRALLDCALR